MDDNEILELYRSGERQQAFNLIVRKYKERLYWHIRNMVNVHEDADDLLQNTFVKVWNSLDTFREDSKLYTWLYRIATNETISFLRRERLRNVLSFTGNDRYLDSFFASDPFFNGDKIQTAVRKAIAKLPPKQRTVFTMRYFDELKYEEMSEILGTSEGALKASYHHAFYKVQEWVKEELGV